MATGGDAVEGPVPALVRVLACNPVTSITILACLNTADARHLRRLHPAVPAAVAGIPWCDTETPVADAVRWRAALSAAVGARLAPSAVRDLLTAVAALRGVTHLDLHGCKFVTNELLLRLPTSLRMLSVGSCFIPTAHASFAHLTALVSLDCSATWLACKRTDDLPPSLQELDVSKGDGMPPGTSLAHLRQLRVLRAGGSGLGDATVASLPPSVEKLHAADCIKLTLAVSFAHLTALHELDIAHSTIGDASLATMPPSLVCLRAHGCKTLTPAAMLPHLPALRLLDVGDTRVGDALVASLPPSLVELRLAECGNVTAGASLDRLHALRLLHCSDTALAPAALDACRVRGCTVLAARRLWRRETSAHSLALLSDGRLASRESDGVVRLWDVAAGGEATAVPRSGHNQVRALAALRHGRRLAIGTIPLCGKEGCIEVWDVESVPPAHRVTIKCHCDVWALAALADDRLAAGCVNGKVLVVDVDAGAVVATLTGHSAWVTSLAVLPDGTLASGSRDNTVRLWDVGTGACVATLTGHTSEVWSLAVLADGRLVSRGNGGDAVQLVDVAARACVGVLGSWVTSVAALPDGRLATGAFDGTVRLWDTRPAAAAGASRAVGAVPSVVVGELGGCVSDLALLTDGRLACSSSGTGWGTVHQLELPPPAACE